jgi:hypothetical protein
MIMSQVLEQSSELSLTELSQGLAFPYATLKRWRWRHQLPLRQRPGPKKYLPLPYEELQEKVSALAHRLQRTFGMKALYEQYLDSISRRHLQSSVNEYRRHLRQRRRGAWKSVRWLYPNAAWAVDVTEVGRDHHGQLLRLVMCRDLASRFQFDPAPALVLAGLEIQAYLRELFESYGAPLVLKRDNGSVLNTPGIDQVLASYGVITLNSPGGYPRYNGGIERGIGLFKNGMTPCLPQPHRWELEHVRPLVTAQSHLENCRVRRCLKGFSAAQAFLQRPRLRVSKRVRRQTFDWIAHEYCAILSSMKKPNHPRAWRWAVESWLVRQGLICVSSKTKTKKVLPHFHSSSGS